MKTQIRKKLKKHERARQRYLLVKEGAKADELLKINKIHFKEVELKVRSLIEKQKDRVIIRINRGDIDKVKELFKENKIKIANISGTLRGLLR